MFLRVLQDQFIAVHNRKPPGTKKLCVRTVREIEHHYVVSSGILAGEFRDQHPLQWTTQALKTVQEAIKL
jgi:hypothetical protein